MRGLHALEAPGMGPVVPRLLAPLALSGLCPPLPQKSADARGGVDKTHASSRLPGTVQARCPEGQTDRILEDHQCDKHLRRGQPDFTAPAYPGNQGLTSAQQPHVRPPWPGRGGARAPTRGE